MHHGTLFKRIYNNYSPGLFSLSYVQAKLAEVSYMDSVYINNLIKINNDNKKYEMFYVTHFFIKGAFGYMEGRKCFN